MGDQIMGDQIIGDQINTIKTPSSFTPLRDPRSPRNFKRVEKRVERRKESKDEKIIIYNNSSLLHQS